MSAIPTHIPAPLGPPSADLRDHARASASWLGQPALRASISVAAGGLTRTATISVLNLAGRACKGLFYLLVTVATDEEGGLAGGQTLAVTKGIELASLSSESTLLVMTDPDGTAEVETTLVGAGTRHVLATVVGVAQGSGAVAFA